MPTNPGKIDRLIQDGYEFKLGDYLNRGFQLFSKEPGPIIGFGAILALIAIGPTILQFASGAFGSTDPSDTFLYSVALPLVAALIQLPLTAGMYLYIRKLANDEDRTFNDFFSGFSYWGQLLVMALVLGFIVVIGFLFLIIPGIYLAVGYSLAVPLLVLGEMDFWTAMETSRKVVTKNWWYWLLFAMLVGIIGSLGYVALIVGIAATIPLGYCMQYAAYEDIIGEGQSGMEDRIEEIGKEDDDIFHGIDS